jgi:hypothetical protein
MTCRRRPERAAHRGGGRLLGLAEVTTAACHDQDLHARVTPHLHDIFKKLILKLRMDFHLMH